MLENKIWRKISAREAESIMKTREAKKNIKNVQTFQLIDLVCRVSDPRISFTQINFPEEFCQ